MNTPVIFVTNELLESTEQKFNTPGRFEGILDFFRVLRIENNRLTSNDDILNSIEKINTTAIIKNKDNWKPYAEKLKKQIIEFFKN